MKKYKIKNLDELNLFAKDLTSKIKGGDIFGLSGPLGSGKTTLVQAVAKELGIKARVASPTFVIVKNYKVKNHKTIKNLCHIDLYRIENLEKNIGLEEFLGKKDTIVFIEWAEKAKKILPSKTRWIQLKVGDSGTRLITIK